jgi:hypothetical protein
MAITGKSGAEVDVQDAWGSIRPDALRPDRVLDVLMQRDRIVERAASSVADVLTSGAL